MKANTASPALTRRDRLIHELVHDPYKTKSKLPEPTVCPGCNAVFHRGRWQWSESWPADAHKEMCQACHRTHDNYPAGVITLAGAFALAHKTELINIARRHEKLENAEHPLHRIMRIEEQSGSLVMTTTDIHLPRRIADAIHHAFKGDMDVSCEQEGCLFRAQWRREE